MGFCRRCWWFRWGSHPSERESWDYPMTNRLRYCQLPGLRRRWKQILLLTDVDWDPENLLYSFNETDPGEWVRHLKNFPLKPSFTGTWGLQVQMSAEVSQQTSTNCSSNSSKKTLTDMPLQPFIRNGHCNFPLLHVCPVFDLYWFLLHVYLTYATYCMLEWCCTSVFSFYYVTLSIFLLFCFLIVMALYSRRGW